MAFAAMSDSDVSAELDSVSMWINKRGANIVCLQESHFSSRNTFDSFKEGLTRLRYGFFVNATTSRADSQTGSGFAVLSAYPIVRHGISDADESSINAVWADVKVGRDTVRIFNTPLQSTGITREDSQTTLSAHIIEDKQGGDKLMGVARKMYGNYKLRAAEAKHISSQIKGSKYPVIVCGDFNDTPVSFTYRKMKTRRLEDAFVECGRGVEYTYKGLYNIFRIDYIFSDKEFFNVKSYDSYSMDLSDHKALIVRLGRDS
jgi:endonuclease/exonuclease/phosphatase family metal-dependent hydrolase